MDAALRVYTGIDQNNLLSWRFFQHPSSGQYSHDCLIQRFVQQNSVDKFHDYAKIGMSVSSSKRGSTMAMLDIAPHQAVEQVQQAFALSDDELARALASSPRTVNRWRTNSAYPQHESRERLAVLVKLAEHLTETFKTFEASHAWMNTDNRYLGGWKPADAIVLGRFDRVEAALDALDAGIFV